MNQLGSKIFEFVFNQLIRQDFLKGHRSYIAGASSIFGGLVVVLDMIVAGHYDETKMGVAWAGFTFGYAIIGNAGKKDATLEVEKAKLAAKEASNG